MAKQRSEEIDLSGSTRDDLIREREKYQDLSDKITVASTPESIQMLEAGLADKGLSVEQIANSARKLHELSDPYGPNPWADKEQMVWNDFEQAPLYDMLAATYNTFFIDGLEGMANILPTEAEALIGETDFTQGWINKTNDFFESHKAWMSDDYYKNPKEWTDNLSGPKLWGHIGQGLGYIMGVRAGAKGFGAIGGGTKAASRLGGWSAGTGMMYSDIYHDMKEKGFEGKDAARIALSASGIVSLTEGAALEAIGKTATAWIPKDIATGALKGSFITGAKNPFYEFQKRYSVNLLKGLASKEGREALKNGVKNIASSTVKGGAIEFGQEFSQTYIEDEIKHLYDKYISKTDFIDDDRMFSIEQLQDATLGGIIGAMLGGGMGGAGSVNTSFINNREAVIGYVSNKVKQGKTKDIQKLYTQLDKQFKNKKISEQDYISAKKQLDDTVKYADDTKYLGVEGSVANTQLKDLLDASEYSRKAMNNISQGKDLDPLVAMAYKANNKMAQQVVEKMSKEANQIIETKKPLTKSKKKFDGKVDQYKELLADVIMNKVSKKDFQGRLDKISISKEVDSEIKEISDDEVSSEEFKGQSNDQLKQRIEDIQSGEQTEEGLKEYDKLQKEIDQRENKKNEIREEINNKQELEQEQNEETSKVEQNDSTSEKPKKEALIPKRNLTKEERESIEKKYGVEVEQNIKDGSYQVNSKQAGNPMRKIGALAEIEKLTQSQETSEVEEEGDEMYWKSELMDASKKEADALNEIKEIEKEGVELDDSTSDYVQELQNTAKAEKLRVDNAQKKLKEIENSNVEQVVEDVSKEVAPTEEEKVETTEAATATEVKETPSPTIQKGSILHKGQTYSVSEDGVVVNKQTNQTVTKDNALHQEILSKAGMIEEDSSTVDDIQKEFQEKKKASKTSESVDELWADESLLDELKEELEKKTDKEKDDDVKNQISGFSEVEYDSKISENPEMYRNIVEHFKKIFPGISVELINELTDKFGNQVLGRIIGDNISINRNQAFQSTLVHEFAEAYLAIVNESDPYLVKKGLEFVRGSKFHEEAKELYSNYSDEVQLKEALVQAITESSMEVLQNKFNDEGKSSKFVTWLKNFWNRIKSFFGKEKSKSIIEAMASDFVLRSNPLTSAVPNISLAYQLGQRETVKSPLESFTSNLANSSILMARFKSDKNNTNPDGLYAERRTFMQLYDQYRRETLNQNKGSKLFNGKIIGPGVEQLMNPDSMISNLVDFTNELNEQYPELIPKIKQLIGSSLDGVIAKDIDHSKVEIKATGEVTGNARMILSSIIDDNTNSPYSKDNVIRTILSINEKTYGQEGFKNALERQALRDPIAAKLKFIMDNLGPEFKNPIIRELSSLEQIEFTSIVLMKDKDGKVVFRKRTVNTDYQQEEDVKKYANLLLRAVRNGQMSKSNAIINDSKRNDNDTRKKQVLQEELMKVFELSNFNIDVYTKSTNNPFHYLYTIFKVGSTKINNKSTEEDVVRELKNMLKQITIAETEMDVLQPSFVNTMGNRVPSIHLSSWFTETRKVLNDKRYIERLQKTEVYKNNPIVKAIAKGMKMKVSRHDAISNTINNRTDEYSKQSTIDNKINGLLRFSHTFLTQSPYYDQWVGVTADRGYQTFFTAKKHKIVDKASKEFTSEGIKMLKESAQRDQTVIDSIKDDWSGLSKEELNKFVDNLNLLTLHDVKVIGNEIKVVPVTSKDSMTKYRKDIANLNKDLKELGLDEYLAEQTEEDIEYLTSEYFFNDYFNRQALEDLYAGPYERHIIKTKLDGVKKVKDVTEAIKRTGLANSVGVKNELDAPVTVIVLDTRGISDSFSHNGSHLQAKLMEQGGELDVVGSSVKDTYYHVDHFDGGRTVSMKMSTLGLERVTNEDGDYIGHNFSEFTDSENKSKNSTAKIGDAIIALEDYMATLDKFTNNPYIKIVDNDVMKNEMPPGAKVISIDQFMEMANKNQFDEILSNSSQMNFLNYRTTFNLHKDTSKVPLSEQKVKFGSQVSLLALSHADKETIGKIEKMIVDQLQNQLKGTAGQLKNVDRLIENALLNADETQSDYTKEVLQEISDYNQMSDAYKALEDIESNSVLDTKEKQNKELQKLLKNNDNLMPIYNRLNHMVEPESISKIMQSYKDYSFKITSLDHPNLKYVIEQSIASTLTKKGIDLKVAGNYLRVIPDSNEDLKTSNPETGEVSDIAVPWSMFGGSRVEAEAKLAEANRTGQGLRTIAVRIPTSGETMIFAAKVKYFIDGKSNNVAVPAGFIEVSDSDHDADKLFVYRADMNDDGSPKGSLETQIFEEYYKIVSSPGFIKSTHEQSVEVAELKKRADNIQAQMTDVSFEVEKSLRTLEGTSGFANAMKDGLEGVGIFAVAVKTLSVMYQSGVKLKSPIEINLGGEYNINGEKVSKVVLEDISLKTLEDTAMYLQAALDNAKEMALGFSGVNKDNIGTVSAMLIAGMKIESITAVINNKDVQNYLKDINSDSSLLSLKESKDKSQQQSSYQYKEKVNIVETKATFIPSDEDAKNLYLATKADPLNQPIKINIADGIYKNTIKYKHKKTAFYKVETINGERRASKLSFNEAYHNLISSESDVLTSYFELENIGKELAKITPLIQLDGGLKNTGRANQRLQENLRNLQDSSKFNYFDSTALIERVKYVHYMKLNSDQRTIEQQHFLTENDGVYTASKELASKTDEGLTNLDYVKATMDEVIQSINAQKLLSHAAKNRTKKELDKWFEDFINKFETLKNIMNGSIQFVSEGSRKNIEARIKETKDPLNAAEKAIYERMQKEDAILEEYSATIEVDGKTMNILEFLAENLFLKHLEITTVGDNKKISPKKVYKTYTDAEKKQIKNSYNELRKYSETLANDLLDYQLLVNGMNQKIGSFAEMLPNHILISYLRQLSKKKANKDEVAMAQSMAYQINTAVKMPMKFPEAEMAQEVSMAEASSRSEEKSVPFEFYEKNGELYIRDKNYNLIPASKFGSFMTNGIYFKFGDIKEYSKLYHNKEVVSKEEIEEVKKCFRI